MAEGLNRVMLFGNLGADPELRTTQGGTAVMKLRLATTERYKDNSGAWQDRTEWHRVVVWGKRAEALHRILAKGSTIFIEGSLRTSSYDDKDGVKRYTTEIHANNILLGGRGGGAGASRGGGDDYGAPPAPRAAPQRSGGRDYRDAGPPPADDVPPDTFGYGGGGQSDEDIPF
ncbi:MAG: single-stranded DNA-binding protein [Polyangiaceae bacterium]|nr:single-stranded DNA-binding protein [Polyangiaceae bacterium]